VGAESLEEDYKGRMEKPFITLGISSVILARQEEPGEEMSATIRVTCHNTAVQSFAKTHRGS